AQPAQRYVPGSKVWSYSPENGASVPFSRRTWYRSGSSSARHCSSVFWTFVIILSLIRVPPYSLATGAGITRVRDGGSLAAGRSLALKGGAENEGSRRAYALPAARPDRAALRRGRSRHRLVRTRLDEPRGGACRPASAR